MLKGGQLKGLFDQAVVEFCSREYTYTAGNKLSVVKKEKMVEKLGFSPDNADSIAVLVEVARQHGAVAWGKSIDREVNVMEAVARKSDELYSDDDSEAIVSEIYALQGRIK
jgi:ribulose-5-phosphate 4-epimerase/fuculose-1-phosphate aldolase